MRILIVEDSIYKLRTVEDILRKWKITKYEVAICLSDAVELLSYNQYSLIILDLGFCVNSKDEYRKTYNARQGLELIKIMRFQSRKYQRPMPAVIVYSETEISEEEKTELFGKAENETELQELLDKWYKLQKKPINVLIVEDEVGKKENIRQVLSQFKDIGYKEANHAKQAQEICEESDNIDIIILDMCFPWQNSGTPHVKNAVKLVKELEKSYWKTQKKMPYIIAYSIIPFEDSMIKYGCEIPKTFYAQTFFTGGLKEVLAELLASKEEG